MLDFWNVFISVLNDIISECVPVKKKSGSRKRNRVSYPENIRRIILRKRRLWRNRDDLNVRREYDRENDSFRRASERYRSAREKKVLDSDDPNKMYKYVRRQRVNDNGISPLKINGSVVVSDVEKARVLNDAFAKHFTVDDGNVPVIDSRVPNGVNLSHANLSPVQIKKVLKS